MRLSPLRCMIVAVVVLVGCEHDCYDIEIRPQGDGFARKITCWHVSGKDDKETQPRQPKRLARIAKLYANRETPDDAKKQIFSGRFVEVTPGDVGGSGRLVRYASPMGDAWCYVERFRGNDDLEAQLPYCRQSTDKICDRLIGWLTIELGREPGFPKLKKFLDTDLRQDLKNIGVYIWIEGVGDNLRSNTQITGELYAKLGLYLCERGYCSPRDMPWLMRCFVTDDCEPLLAHVQRLLARRLGTSDDRPIPASLEFLGDPVKLEASFNKYIRSTELFRKRYRQWEAAKETDPNAKEPMVENVRGEMLISDIIFPWLARGSKDTLEVQLFCGRKPYSTNGRWDENIAAATWSCAVGFDDKPPTVCFAFWSEPNETAQKEHFGEVLLADEALAEYALWYRSLKPEEAEEWGRFVGGLKPDSDWKAAVKAFRFAADPKPAPSQPEANAAGLADVPRRLLLNEEKE